MLKPDHRPPLRAADELHPWPKYPPRHLRSRNCAKRSTRSTRAASPADAARRHHRPPDPGEADPGSRLRVPPGARGRHDAAPGRSVIAASCRSTPSRASGASSSRRSPTCKRRSRCMPTSRSSEPAMRDSGALPFRLHGTFVAHFSAQAAVEAVAKSKGDLALVSATSSRTPWWLALEADGAPKIIARLPFVERADHPAALPVFVISRVADERRGDGGRDLERARLRLERRYRARAVAARRDRCSARYRLRRRGAAGLGHGRDQHRQDQGCPDRSGGLGALHGPRRQPRNALYGALDRVELEIRTVPKLFRS